MTAQTNIVNDISTLTRIPNKTLTELTHKINLCIASIIHEAKEAGEQTVVINIGIGTLGIDLIDMQCKFVPSKDLKTAIKAGSTAKIDPLELVLEQSLAEKLINLSLEAL